MSRIENYRIGRECRQREMWNDADIAEYLGISSEKATVLHDLANKAYNVTGYGDINKDCFIEFMKSVEAQRESQRLQDEANAATILYAQKGYSQNWITSLIAQAISLLR